MSATPIWPDRGRHDEFFDRLRQLIEEYPELGNHQAREYAADPTDDFYEAANGNPAYDPESPVYIGGLVVVVNFRNMDGYEDLSVLDPYEQSHYVTQGMLIEGFRVVG